MVKVTTSFIAAGANRHPAAAAWDEVSGLLVFGAGNNIAVWDVEDKSYHGIKALLPGHTDAVNAVTFLHSDSHSRKNNPLFITGAADKTLRIWTADVQSPNGFSEAQVLAQHAGSVNCIAALPDGDIFVSGAADASVKIWRADFTSDGAFEKAELTQSIALAPRYFPLAIALARLDSGALVLAIAGTRTQIQIFVHTESGFELSATLSGHEAWIRSLAFTRESTGSGADLLLASACQDKYIRLWRIHQGEDLPSNAASDPALGSLGKALSNKAHRFETGEGKYSVTFEALLLGHEDWIYTARWHLEGGKLRLLSASADNSLAVWEPDRASGVWVCVTRLGEISAQKGAKTATGSTGGFWIGLWSGAGDAVVSLGRTGSWRLWRYDAEKDMWNQDVAISGHVKEVKSVCWSSDSSYMLTTSSDQTTRLFAPWAASQTSSWHEFSRPQIHGYDLNCLSAISPTRFISGADEKLLRVFDLPAAVSSLLSRLCNITLTDSSSTLPDAANIPVLGLSNKAIQAIDDTNPSASSPTNEDPEPEADPTAHIPLSTFHLPLPPFEDHLSRHLLWPETEKLYGHGYEISAVAAAHNTPLVATACKASSLEHAVIRLYDTRNWREVRPPLAAHGLTVTSLAWAEDDEYLLSTGRDRMWVVYRRAKRNGNGEGDADGNGAIEAGNEQGQELDDEELRYITHHTNPKGHTRMILSGAWAPGTSARIFATAGRDKTVRIWHMSHTEVRLLTTCTASAAVTSVAFLPRSVQGRYVFAYGTEEGEVTVCWMGVGGGDALASDASAGKGEGGVREIGTGESEGGEKEKEEEGKTTASIIHTHTLDTRISPSATVTKLAWRGVPASSENREEEEGNMQLAVASDDGSVRLFHIGGDALASYR